MLTDTVLIAWEGPALWQIALAVLLALRLDAVVVWVSDWLADWWDRNRSTGVEDAAPAGDGPIGTPVRFVAERPDGWAPPPEPRWHATARALHRADCHLAPRGVPLEFAYTVQEAREVAERDGLRECRHCDPLGPTSADTGDREAVSTP